MVYTTGDNFASSGVHFLDLLKIHYMVYTMGTEHAFYGEHHERRFTIS